MRWQMTAASVPEDQAWGWQWCSVKHSRAYSAHCCLSTRRWWKTLLLCRRGQSWRMERDEVSFWRSVVSLFFRRGSLIRAAGLHFWGLSFVDRGDLGSFYLRRWWTASLSFRTDLPPTIPSLGLTGTARSSPAMGLYPHPPRRPTPTPTLKVRQTVRVAPQTGRGGGPDHPWISGGFDSASLMQNSNSQISQSISLILFRARTSVTKICGRKT